MTSKTPLQDDRFQDTGILTPLAFMALFIFFVYGALLVGLLGLSDWIIHAWHISILQNMGNAGIFLLALIIPALWFILAFIIATLPYIILRSKGHIRRARRIRTIILFAMFHIFAIPWILWPTLRRASPKLRQKHREKLKKRIKKRNQVDIIG
ncbi:hypothetical protein [Bartonella tamiae]|uniref:Uncharacterized protein n=1 Tax=Bartonella tamiae Th239 TaxID=1094558 RepID=J0R5Q6_9HYPH|nr:hypothetical protein [Bartonella tamiae]EJF91024.1 hypothetical protein ME5_00356 [Bartonella tamiae Th239]